MICAKIAILLVQIDLCVISRRRGKPTSFIFILLISSSPQSSPKPEPSYCNDHDNAITITVTEIATAVVLHHMAVSVVV